MAQLLLNWATSQGVSVIPSARSEQHMLENLKLASITGFVRLRTILKSFTFAS